MASRSVYQPSQDTATPRGVRERLKELDEDSRRAIEYEAKSLVNVMHKRGARSFGIVSAYELLEQLYKLDKAVKLGLQPDLRKTKTLIGLAESAEDIEPL